VKEIPLASGKGVALVDDEDYEWLLQYKWYRHDAKSTAGNIKSYAAADLRFGVKQGKKVLMHRFITDPPRNLLVDHIDRDGLNNQRSNLRFVDYSQNLANSVKRGEFYKGVRYDKRRDYYYASITVNGVFTYLGSYPTPEEAARAYDVALIKHFGAMARPNFPTN